MTGRLVALSFALCSAACWAADSPPPLTIAKHELPNGLKIVLAEDKSRPVANLQIWYHVGSKDERAGRTGFAHLFEHMMFRGSKNVGPEEHMRLIREAGGEVNAYTTFDTTVYWETFPSNYLERMLWLEADRMESLVVNDENFQKEREVVKEERRLRIENPPYGTLIDVLLPAVYSRYPYKHPPIGSMEDLNKATTADVKEFFETYYVPNNATIVLVGDFDTANALALITKHFGRLPRSKKPVPRVSETEPERTAFKESTAKFKNAPLEGVVMAWHLPPMGHPDSYALAIASAILSDGKSSRLYRRLVYEEQSALQAAGQAIQLEGPSVFFGFALANQGKNVKEMATSFQVVIEQMRKQPVEAAELEKAKNQVIARFILERQSVQSKADFLGQMAVMRGNPELYNTELDNYVKVTAADVQRVCQKYLTNSRETRLWMQPEAAQ